MPKGQKKDDPTKVTLFRIVKGDGDKKEQVGSKFFTQKDEANEELKKLSSFRVESVTMAKDIFDKFVKLSSEQEKKK